MWLGPFAAGGGSSGAKTVNKKYKASNTITPFNPN
jgi:hypothetical protein